MTADERRRRVLDLVDAALDLPQGECAEFLTRACSGDPTLQDEIEAVLGADTDMVSYLRGSAAQAFIDQGSIPPNTRIGQFQTLRLIGTGGMGEVYLARRVVGAFDELVAIKILGADRGSRAFINRFKAERQILANLRHPNIATLLDGGATPDQRPFLVMEYIEGQPIDAFCTTHQLSINDRFELFRKVCRAVHFAHRNLVIHRDLKPKNILVTAEGEPKLLDFGIAKLLSPQGSDTVTVDGLRGFTPAYVSPEQIAGLPITTAGDIYSLGVVLFELLTDHRPYAFSAEPSIEEIRRVVCETQPPNPSMFVPIRALRTDLRRDIDKLLHMALHKESDQRYASAEALSSEISRYLAGRPVLAQGPSLGYRVKKLLFRHKLASAFGIISALLTAGLLLTLALARQAAITERDRAQEIVELMVSLFESSDPYQNLGQRISAYDVLTTASARIRSELREQPDIRATLLDTVGRVFLNLGEYDAAEDALQEALGLRQQRPDARQAELADSHIQIARVAIAINDYPRAEAILREALALDILDRDPLRRARALAELGLARQEAHDFSQADASFQEALSLHQSELGDENPMLADTLRRIGRLRIDQGRFDEAEPLFLRAQRILTSHFGPDHPRVAQNLADLGLLYWEQGRSEEAMETLSRALALKERVFGPGHFEVARTLHDLGLQLTDLGRFEEAEDHLGRALRIEIDLFGEDDLDVSDTHIALAVLHMRRGQYEKSDHHYRRAIEIREAMLGSSHIKVMDALRLSAGLREAEGRHEEGLAIYHRVLEQQLSILGDQHPRVASTYNNMASVYFAQKKLDQAADAYQRSRAILEKALEAEHPNLLAVINNLAAVRAQQGRTEEAERLLGEILSIRERILDPDHLDVANSLNSVGVLQLRAKNFASAHASLERCHRIVEAKLGPTHTVVARVLRNLGRAAVGLGRDDEAEQHFRKSLAIRESVMGTNHPDVAAIVPDLAALLVRTGRQAEADALEARLERLGTIK